jgi:hypothetical protein
MLIVYCSQFAEVVDEMLDITVAYHLLYQQQFFSYLLDVVETKNTLLSLQLFKDINTSCPLLLLLLKTQLAKPLEFG